MSNLFYDDNKRYYGLQQPVHDVAECPCEACAFLREGRDKNQLAAKQAELLAAPVTIRPNRSDRRD